MLPAQPSTITQGSLNRGIWQLTWPITLSQALFMLPNAYDAIWLGQLGPAAQAAGGLAMSVRITMISVLMALSLGSGAVVARYVGAKDIENANRTVLQGILMMIAAAGSLGILGIIFARPLMVLAGADAVTLPLAVRYAHILFGGLIAMELLPSMGGMLNAAGAPQVMLGMTIASTGALLACEPFLVRWLNIEGAALAMVGSNAIGMFFGFAALLSGRYPVRLDLHQFHLDFPIMASISRVALPAVLQRGAPNLSLSVLTRIVAAYGAPALAAWVIVQRIFSLALIPCTGLSGAAPAMVGQNLGAAQPERAGHSVGVIARLAGLVAGCILTLLVLFAPQVMGLFSQDAETLQAGMQAMRLLSIGYFAFSLNGVYDAAQSGAGDTRSPMLINLVTLFFVLIPLALLLPWLVGLQAGSSDGATVSGVWLALMLSWILQATLMGLRFRQGRWKLQRVV
jgi:putative MATE family efflux protein